MIITIIISKKYFISLYQHTVVNLKLSFLSFPFRCSSLLANLSDFALLLVLVGSIKHLQGLEDKELSKD